MKKFSTRSLVALGVVAAMGLATPLIAAASGAPVGKLSQRSLHQEIVAYRNSRLAIQAQFRSAVNAARAAYNSSLLVATTSAERSAAQQALETAIIQAAATRSAALTALGKAPVDPM